jgi:hypothetical protein
MKSSAPSHVYVLLDPRSWEIRYVGQTRHPARRVRAHMRDSASTHKTHWLGQLRKSGQAPVMRVIQTFDGSVGQGAVNTAESFWIQHLLERGEPLTNLATGGLVPPPRKGVRHTADTKAKIARSMTGRKMCVCPEGQANKAAANRARLLGAPVPADVRAKISASQRGRPKGPMSEATRAKLSAARKGRSTGPRSETTRAKISASQKGVPKRRKPPNLGPNETVARGME